MHALTNKLKLILLVIFSSNAAGEDRLLDRIIVEINSIAYTQRHIELFVSVFDSISNSPDQKVRIADEKNWTSILTQFQNFMLIEQEAHRLGSYLPSNNMIEKGHDIYKDRYVSDENLKLNSNRLHASESSIKKSIISVLRVASFLRSKQNRGSTQLNSDTEFQEFASSPWFSSLQDRAIIRYMDEGKTFKTIRSF